MMYLKGLKIKQKKFVLLLIKQQYFLGTSFSYRHSSVARDILYI